MQRLNRALRESADLLFPTTCPSCGGSRDLLRTTAPVRATTLGLCADCATRLRASIAPETSQLTPHIPIASAATYADPIRPLLDAYKERGRVDAVRALAATLRIALVTLPRDHRIQPLLVPMPSRARARAKRGFDHVPLLLEHALPRAGCASVLRLVRPVNDQAGLDRDSRAENLRGAMAADPVLRGRRCVLVDDVVTTGATLREAARAIEHCGGRVVGAAVIARVPLLAGTQTGKMTALQT